MARIGFDGAAFAKCEVVVFFSIDLQQHFSMQHIGMCILVFV